MTVLSDWVSGSLPLRKNCCDKELGVCGIKSKPNK